MNDKSRVFSTWVVAVLGFSSLLWGSPAVAFVQEITAMFRPNPSDANQNRFTNTTPVSGYCQSYPSQCYEMFSIRLPITASGGPLEANPSDPRKTALWKVPAQWREVSVTNTQGETQTVEIRISGIGSTYGLDRHAAELVGGGVPAITAHQKLWVGSSWVNAASPCRYSGVGLLGASWYTFFWKTPVEGNCVKPAAYAIPLMSYSYLDIAYELRTPNPLAMSAGTYTGVLNYGIGPNQDFDLGDMMLPSDSALTLNFTLTVEHILKVELPPGGNRVELLPEGGWQAWLNRGRQPARLFRDQTFRIAASSRFKMNLECSLVIGNTCGLRNGAGDEVPLQVAVSLPFGLNDQYGQTVNKLPLRLDGVGTELFQALHYVNNRPGTLHFEVQKEHVTEMLKQPGTTYSGVVTVVWDSEV
ncbi:hypothetical protein [Pseudomonas fluorescens]|uniref:Fimbrial protein n=1 Tax=Pseudomonas fluorescens TaxID=294 RepID=A0A4Y9TKM2_PSEFL|nr:hypothetical protein E4T65_14385 [Pseudomonas fluorescens]